MWFDLYNLAYVNVLLLVDVLDFARFYYVCPNALLPNSYVSKDTFSSKSYSPENVIFLNIDQNFSSEKMSAHYV